MLLRLRNVLLWFCCRCRCCGHGTKPVFVDSVLVFINFPMAALANQQASLPRQ